MAPDPEGGHHVGDDDIECVVIAGLHEEVCGAARGPRERSPHTFTADATIAFSRTDGRGERRVELEGEKKWAPGSVSIRELEVILTFAMSLGLF